MVVGPEIEIIGYERKIREMSQEDVLNLADSLGHSRDWKVWDFEALDAIVAAIKAIPLTPAQDTRRWLDILKRWRLERNLSQEQVLAVAGQAGLPTDPKQWDSRCIVEIIHSISAL